MQEFYSFIYEGYIRRQVEDAAKDADDADSFAALEYGVPVELSEDLAKALRFYALHSFLLGLRTGRDLAQ